MKRLFTLASVTLLAISMSAIAFDSADAGNHRRGALIAGLIIGGVTAGIVASQIHGHRGHQYYRYGGQQVRFGQGQVWQQHVSYCYNRYRSYNHHNNLFLAYSGQHHHCRSPWIN